MKSILKQLEKGKILISDGGWGTYLHALGLEIGECPEIWNLTHKKEVLSIAQSYIDAVWLVQRLAGSLARGTPVDPADTIARRRASRGHRLGMIKGQRFATIAQPR